MTDSAAARSEALPREGRVFARELKLGREIETTGGVRVFEATRVESGEAVDVALAEAPADEAAAARVATDAKALMFLESPHAERVKDSGTADGFVFVVTERPRGDRLSDAIAREDAFEVADAIEVVIQAADALAEAHAKGILHGAVAPERVFISRADDAITTTLTGFFVRALDGKGATSGADDVAALGALLRAAILGGDARAIDPELSKIVLRASSADPKDGFVSVFALVTSLAPFAPARAAPTLERITRVSETPAQPSTQELRISQYHGPRSARAMRNFVAQVPIPISSRKPRTERAWQLAAAIAVVLAIFAIVVALAFRRSPHDAHPRSAPATSD